MSVEKSKHEFFEASANSSPDPSVVGATLTGAPSLIVVMSLRLAIPWWVALQQGPPPLHQLDRDSNEHSGGFATNDFGHFLT